MSEDPRHLAQILDLERIEINIFRGHSPQTGWIRVFGGLVIAQALVACSRTVEGRLPHSLHGYFLLPGDPSAPIVYEVDRIRDGKSFTTRRCNAIQHGQAIFSLSASYQVEETGLEHAVPMPDVPDPESLPGDPEAYAQAGAEIPKAVQRMFERERTLELRPVDVSRYARHAPMAPVQYVWIRAVGPMPDDQAFHRAALAYLSDMTLLDMAARFSTAASRLRASITPFGFIGRSVPMNGSSMRRTVRTPAARAASPAACFMRATSGSSPLSPKRA
jgi:acyl-CoA thioesterase II